MGNAVAPFLTHASQLTDLYILEANAHKSENDGAVLNMRATIYRERETGSVYYLSGSGTRLQGEN